MFHRARKNVITIAGTIALSLGLALGASAPAQADISVYGGSCSLSEHWGVWFSFTWGASGGSDHPLQDYLNYVVARSDGPLELNGASVAMGRVSAFHDGSWTSSFRSAGRNSDGQYIYRADPDRYIYTGTGIVVSHPNGAVCGSNTTVYAAT